MGCQSWGATNLITPRSHTSCCSGCRRGEGGGLQASTLATLDSGGVHLKIIHLILVCPIVAESHRSKHSWARKAWEAKLSHVRGWSHACISAWTHARSTRPRMENSSTPITATMTSAAIAPAGELEAGNTVFNLPEISYLTFPLDRI